MKDQEKKHKSQITAAVIISIIFILLFAGYAVLYFVVDGLPVILRLLFGALMTAFAIGMVIILKERLGELRKGETDDLSDY